MAGGLVGGRKDVAGGARWAGSVKALKLEDYRVVGPGSSWSQGDPTRSKERFPAAQEEDETLPLDAAAVVDGDEHRSRARSHGYV